MGGSSLLLGHSHFADTSFMESQAELRCPLWSARHRFLAKPGRQELPVAAMPFTLPGVSLQETRPDPPSLAVTLWGQTFSNPVGELLRCIQQPAVTCHLPCSLGRGTTQQPALQQC